MLKYKLSISYDGTRYGGWQVQPNATSIQTLIENALETALRKSIKLIGSGRTDSGVHALNQVAHFSFDGTVDQEKLHHSLNGLLPDDIRIQNITQVAEDFHARFSAKGKIYHYRIDCGSIQNPFTRLYAYHLPYPIDLELLKEAAKIFVGKHDFTSFSNEAHRGSAARDPVRTLSRLDVLERGDEIVLEFEGNGFLYKMVRNITGTLLDIARGKIPITDIESIFEAKDRSKAGTTAPAHGLFLVDVKYDPNQGYD